MLAVHILIPRLFTEILACELNDLHKGVYIKEYDLYAIELVSSIQTFTPRISSHKVMDNHDCKTLSLSNWDDSKA